MTSKKQRSSETEKIRWAPKVSRSRIWQLYQNDARGTIDETLIEDVGFSLWLRCQSIILVSHRQVECPRCHNSFAAQVVEEPDAIKCPTLNCGWQTTQEQYHNSWRHQDLIGSNALPAFETFVKDYPSARTPQTRMLCIDHLIHAFHWGLQNLPNRSVANNLIEGSHADVVALLDKLSEGNKAEDKEQWRKTVQAMTQRRREVKPQR